MSIQVTKANGQLETFSESKVRQSLKRAGAEPEVINKILAQLIGKLYPGISTKEIYQQVFEQFNQLQSSRGYRYSLKNSLMQLGPSGYPFEKFIARLMDQMGYKTQTSITIKGKCIDQEIDVIAAKDGRHFMVECKFHNKPGLKTRSKEAMYTQARFEDVSDRFDQAWLVTNTKLTANAVKYGRCKNMHLIAWRYPEKGSLEQLIEEYKLHPLTCLNFLTPHEQQLLFQNNLVLCRDLIKVDDKKLELIGFQSGQIKKIRQFFKESSNIL